MKKLIFIDDEEQFQYENKNGRSFPSLYYKNNKYEYYYDNRNLRKRLHLIEQFGYYYYMKLKK